MQKCVGKSLYERRKPSKLNLIFNIIIIIFLFVIIGEVIFNSYYTSIYVKGESMEPTLNGAPNTSVKLSGGDYLFVNKHAKPDYFDIVVVITEDYNEEGELVKYDIIKRVVAFGGDTVKIDHGQLYIKYKGESEFKEIEEPYLSEDKNKKEDAVNTFDEHVVADGCMFLLGDNRSNSKDSRARGGKDYPMSDLVGVVPEWSLKYKSQITAIYTFFEFTLGFGGFGSKIYGN